MSVEGTGKARILVVDDSKLMRKAAHKMLGEEFDVITAEDGQDAWGQVGRDTGIQVVFTDLNMPNMDGYELLREIRGAQDPGVQGLPVIVVTGAENDESARMKALDLGATDFITKPFTTSDLVARARAHSTYQRVTRQLQSQVMLDGLTGLANKAGFMDRLRQDMAYARRHGQALCLVRLEVEDFQRFFLHNGRDVAEGLVLQVARLLRARIRKEDTAARVGLGSFALSLPGGEEAGIAAMVERVQAEVMASPPMHEGEPLSVVLHAAVLSPLTDASLGPEQAMDACQARLDVARESGVAVLAPAAGEAAAIEPAASEPAASEPTASKPAATEPGVSTPAPPVPAPPVPAVAGPTAPAAVASPAAAPARVVASVDEVLDQLQAGRVQDVVPKLPAVIGRLLPLLRLLGPNQRKQLVDFLQK
ncbi:GGDEF domain-containing response regulator [Arenimonas aestuarii]